MVSAEESPDSKGKLRMKADRISQDEAERIKQDSDAYKETELEKLAPDLFKEQTRAAIQREQEQQKENMEDIKENLFVTKQHKDTTVKDSRVALFSKDYSIPATAAHGEVEGKAMGPQIFGALGAILFLICGGIYGAFRKMMN